jgi:RNA polymerase sigma-70 factor (ECF subfamily)
LSATGVRRPVCVERGADCRLWLSQLRDEGRVGEEATRHLHRLLLRMSYSRLRLYIGSSFPEDEDEIALEAADEAVVGVLAHLDAFRGECLFTTWACEFAVNALIAALHRRRHWRSELPVEADMIVRLAGAGESLERHEEHLELLEAIGQAVNGALSARQREVLLVLAIDGGSPQALAGRLNTSVGALYKSLHDARARLRVQLAARGFTLAG